MKLFRRVLVWLCVIMLVPLPLPASAQDAAKPFKPEEIESLVAPIALHPDALLAQVLMASTYPLEVIEAARFVKANANLQGDKLNEALQQKTWDDSVKSLVMFPQVLAMMDEKLDWLQKLGDAFLAQQADVLAAVQRLRARAQAAGQLKTTPEQNVIVEPSASPAVPAPPTAGQLPAGTPPPPAGAPPAGAPPAPAQLPAASSTTVQVVESPPTVIRIEPSNPTVVHVPSYDPTVVYGAWPPAYPPPYYPYPYGYFAAGAFTFAAGMAVGAALWGGCNWGGGEVNINNSKVNNFSNNVNNRETARNRAEQRNTQRGQGGREGGWQHNPEHRRGAQYKDSATQQRFNKNGPANAQSREAFRGRSQEGGGFGQQGGRGQGGPGQGGLGQQGGVGQGGRGQGGQGGFGQAGGGGMGDRGAQATQRGGGGGLSQGGGSGVSRTGAFDGVGGGRDTQSFSNRGNASRDSFNRSSSGASRGGSGSVSGARSSGGGGARAGGGGGRAGGGGGGRGGGRR